jgi:hypothetical protein
MSVLTRATRHHIPEDGILLCFVMFVCWPHVPLAEDLVEATFKPSPEAQLHRGRLDEMDPYTNSVTQPQAISLSRVPQDAPDPSYQLSFAE